MNTNSEVKTRTEENVNANIQGLMRGQRWHYYSGHLAFDRARSYEIDLLAKAIWKQQLAGHVLLFQSRTANGFCNYYAMRA